MNLIELEIPVEVPVARILVVDTCEELPDRVMLPQRRWLLEGMLWDATLYIVLVK